MTPAPDIAKVVQELDGFAAEAHRAYDANDEAACAAAERRFVNCALSNWPAIRNACDPIDMHCAAEPYTKSALLAARATPRYERKSSDADRENLVIAATSARIAGFYWEGTARSVVADLRACESALALRDAEVEELRATLERTIGGPEPTDDMDWLRHWRDSVVARASRAGMPEGVGLCDWFEALARQVGAPRAPGA